MGKSRQKLLADLSLAVKLFFLIILPLLVSCSLPGVVIVEDKLTAEQHNDLGYVYEQKQLYDLAEKEYMLAAEKRPEWDVPYFNLGNLSFKKGDFPRSEIFYRQALERNGNNTDAMNNLANALLMQDRLDEARLLIERALQTGRKEVYFDTLKRIKEREVLRPSYPKSTK